MSRCYSYPPPGYTLSRAQYEALIESIKLKKERERTKEKKEKRKEKKEKQKRNVNEENKDERNKNSDKSDIENHHTIPKSLSDAKVDRLPKRSDFETEQFERSNVTEEHARPASLSGPSTSSESTENTSKRKRHSLPVNDTCGHEGKVILVRLSSKKQNEFDALIEEEGSTSESRDVNSARDKCANTLGTSAIGQHLCSTRQVKGKSGINSATNLPAVQKMDLQYRNLLDMCFPSDIRDACLYSEDLDWLLLKGKIEDDDQETRAAKKRRFRSDLSLSCSRSSGSEYLREVDVYALPFTVPY